MNYKLFLIILPLILGFISGLFVDSDDVRYKYLNKSPYTPPNWVFPVMWSIIYLTLGYQLYLIVDNKYIDLLGYFITFFGINLIWSPVFFYYANYMLAFILLVIYNILNSLYNMYSYYNIDEIKRKISYFNLIHSIWLIIALYLNAYIVLFN
jgi:tryptophan-rich sensory protein